MITNALFRCRLWQFSHLYVLPVYKIVIKSDQTNHTFYGFGFQKYFTYIVAVIFIGGGNQLKSPLIFLLYTTCFVLPLLFIPHYIRCSLLLPYSETNARETRMKHSIMDNSETQATLCTMSWRRQTKQKHNTQKLRKMSNTDPTKTRS
jgi:hypothetical protein